MQQFSAYQRNLVFGVCTADSFFDTTNNIDVERSIYSNGCERNVGRRDFSALEMEFPFISSMLDCATGHGTQPVLTEMDAIYSDIVKQFLHGSSNMNMLKRKSFCVEQKPVTLKENAKCLFKYLPCVNLFTLKFHPLDHVIEDVIMSGSLEHLYASPWEHFGCFRNEFIQMTSMRKQSQ